MPCDSSTADGPLDAAAAGHGSADPGQMHRALPAAEGTTGHEQDPDVRAARNPTTMGVSRPTSVLQGQPREAHVGPAVSAKEPFAEDDPCSVGPDGGRTTYALDLANSQRSRHDAASSQQGTEGTGEAANRQDASGGGANMVQEADIHISGADAVRFCAPAAGARGVVEAAADHAHVRDGGSPQVSEPPQKCSQESVSSSHEAPEPTDERSRVSHGGTPLASAPVSSAKQNVDREDQADRGASCLGSSSDEDVASALQKASPCKGTEDASAALDARQTASQCTSSTAVLPAIADVSECAAADCFSMASRHSSSRESESVEAADAGNYTDSAITRSAPSSRKVDGRELPQTCRQLLDASSRALLAFDNGSNRDGSSTLSPERPCSASGHTAHDPMMISCPGRQMDTQQSQNQVRLQKP